MRSYIKLYGPPILSAIRELEKIAVNMPEVCIMNTVIMRNIPRSLASDLGGQQVESSGNAVSGYFESTGVYVPIERCRSIVSKSGEMLGEYDFFFEWFKTPDLAQINQLINQIDKALAPLGCFYTFTTKK